MVRLTSKLQGRWGADPDRYRAFWDAPDDDAETRQRGEAAADLWIRNYRITAALGEAYAVRNRLANLEPETRIHDANDLFAGTPDPGTANGHV
jgi:hypothetical protein